MVDGKEFFGGDVKTGLKNSASRYGGKTENI